MRVLLIQPPSNIMANRKESKPCLPPYGLACIAAEGMEEHEVEIYDMQAEGYDTEFSYNVGNNEFITYGDSTPCLIKKIEDFQPDVVGVSCMMSLRHFEACGVIQTIKEVDPNIITVMGGNHPSAMPELVREDCYGKLDHVIMGEGDLSFWNYIKDVETNCANLFQVTAGNHPMGLNELNIPAHELLPLDKYVDIWRKTNYHFYHMRGRFIITSTSRGCTIGCHHCPHEVVFGKGCRTRSLKNLQEEIDYVTESLDVKEIQFHEYNGQIHPWMMEAVAEVIEQYNVRWGYPIGVWVNHINERGLTLAYASGMDYINLAIESHKPDVLATMPGKRVEQEKVKQVIKWCRDIGIYINGFFMIGYPWQTLGDMWATVNYAISLDIDSATFFIVQPLPGTKMWDQVEFVDNFHPMFLRYGKCNIKSPNWLGSNVEHIRHKGREMFLENRMKCGGEVRGGNFVV